MCVCVCEKGAGTREVEESAGVRECVKEEAGRGKRGRVSVVWWCLCFAW